MTACSRLAALAQIDPDQASKLAHWSGAAEIYRIDDDAEWSEHRNLGGLVAALLTYASDHIDSLPPVAVEDLPRAELCNSTRANLNERLGQLSPPVRSLDHWCDATSRPEVWAGCIVWSLDRLDKCLAWVREVLAEIEPVPELLDLAERAAQHADAYHEARLAFRRTYGRQPRKAEAAALGPWMRYVERYRARAEQIAEGRPELLRWYIAHIGVVCEAASWTSHKIAVSRDTCVALLRRADVRLAA